MFASIESFSSFQSFDSPSIEMGNNSKVKTKWKGSVQLEHGRYKDVLFVPSLAPNLLYVYQMTHTGSLKRVIFGPNWVEITDISTGSIIAKGTTNHASKAYEFSHFMPPLYQCTLSSHLQGKVKSLHLLLLQLLLVLQIHLYHFMTLRFRVTQI